MGWRFRHRFRHNLGGGVLANTAGVDKTAGVTPSIFTVV